MDQEELMMRASQLLETRQATSQSTLATRLGLTLDEFNDLLATNTQFFNLVIREYQLPPDPGGEYRDLRDYGGEILEEVLAGKITNEAIAVKTLAAFGMEPADICKAMKKPIEWTYNTKVAEAIERGRIEGITMAAAGLFKKMQAGDFKSIQLYLKGLAAATWGDNPKTGQTAPSTTLAKEIIEMSKFANRGRSSK